MPLDCYADTKTSVWTGFYMIVTMHSSAKDCFKYNFPKGIWSSLNLMP